MSQFSNFLDVFFDIFVGKNDLFWILGFEYLELFLDEEFSDPRKKLIDSLIKHIPKEACIKQT